MIILDINNISLNFGYGALFDKISFTLNEGESISIVGPNGCGKSSLLKIIAGIYKPDSGVVNIRKGATVAYLDQTSSDKKDERIVREVLADAFPELNELKKRLQKLEALLQDQSDEKLVLNYCKLVEEYSDKGGYDIDVQIDTVCSGLNIKEQMLTREYSSLSGGEKTLVQLAKILLQKPSLLLLDEPTNHLDIERIEWLESYVKSFKGASVIVSHDRYFLDKMSNKILDLEGLTPKVYSTNYSGFLEQKQKDFKKQMQAYEDQQIIIRRMREQIKYFSTMGMAKNSSTLCDRAHALQTRLDMLLANNKVEKPVQKSQVNMKIKQDQNFSKKAIEVKNLTVFDHENKPIISDINLVVGAGERIAFVGRNGSGKSTLIKTIVGDQVLRFSGEIVVGPSVKVGYLPQIINFNNEKMTLFDYFQEESCLHEEAAKRVLAKFQFFNGDINKLVKNLSGGEKIRLKLAILLQQNVNCLIFDEPTNHIDIFTKESIEKAIEDFSGTLLFVSHDRYFINKFAQKILEFDHGKTTTYYGNYDDYKLKKNQ